MAFVGDRPVRPLTADEVIRMVQAGILGEDEPVELLHGALVEMSPKSPQQAALKTRLAEWLHAPGRHTVRTEDAVTVPDRTSLPEPDIAVVPTGDYLHAHPTSALLVIEVALTSLKIDLTVKPALYAAMGVECWVVDVAAKRVHVFRDPFLRRIETPPARSPPAPGTRPRPTRAGTAAAPSATAARRGALREVHGQAFSFAAHNP